jgi:hypothetical protein
MSRRAGVAAPAESRATRGKATPNEGADGVEDDELTLGGDDGAAWKQEVEAITNGTHPELAKELKIYEQAMAKEVAQAQRICQLQKSNIESLYDCEKKQADDEQVAQLEFYRSRLVDNIEEKQRKSADQAGGGRPRRQADAGKTTDKKRRRVGLSGLEGGFALPPDQQKADLEEIENAVARYSVRAAAVASEDLRNAAAAADVWFDRGRQVLHCNGHALERDALVAVVKEGQRLEDRWTITAMNAVGSSPPPPPPLLTTSFHSCLSPASTPASAPTLPSSPHPHPHPHPQRYPHPRPHPYPLRMLRRWRLPCSRAAPSTR